MSLKIYETTGIVGSYKHLVATIVCVSTKLKFKVDPILCGSFDKFVQYLSTDDAQVDMCVCVYKNIYTTIVLTKTTISVRVIYCVNDEIHLVISDVSVDYSSEHIPDLIKTFNSLTTFILGKKINMKLI